jgi:lipopolysaccharide export system ATP-binding protein
MTTSRLVAEKLQKRYRQRTIVHGVNLSIEAGEAVALLGPNGAGKTTCFYMLAGLIKPDSGKVLLNGRDVTGYPLYRRSRLGISYLPQESSVFRTLTVEENILAVLQRLEPSPARQRAHLNGLIEEFSLGHVRKNRASNLSGGERRRTEIARALAARPRFLLLDEPLAGIDPIAIGEIRQLIAQLCQRGLGVLITDHNVRDTLSVVKRACILADGNILAEGTPEELYRNEAVKQHYLGQDYD